MQQIYGVYVETDLSKLIALAFLDFNAYRVPFIPLSATSRKQTTSAQ